MKISPRLINSAFENLSAVKKFLEFARRNHFKPKLKPKLKYKPVYKSQEKELVHASLISSLQQSKSVAEQIKAFDSVVKLPVENISCRYSVCEEIERILQPYFPSCFVRLLGSSVSGFGTKGCDIDLSIQFNDTNPHEQVLEHNIHPNEESETEIADNKMSSSKKKLMTVRKILQSLKYDEPLMVIPGRCPILNFYRHNISCDLAVNNSLALQSTNLMLLCGRLDERIIPLMQIINYWAKHFKLVGGPDKLKTYAVFLMLIYFLQTRNPPIMPSLEKMFEKTELLKNFVNWSYDVTKYESELELPKSNDTVEELLREFFLFYRSFDYSQIICPLSSSCMSREVFTEKIDCSKNFQFNTISIQDPLEKTSNVTSYINWENCKNFIRAIISVTEIYQDQNCWIPGPYSWGLACFIDKDVKEFFVDVLVSSVTNNDLKNNKVDVLKPTADKVKYILSYCLQAQCYHLDKNTDFNSLDIPPNVKAFIENYFKNLNSNNLMKDSCVSSTNCSEDSPSPNFVTEYVCAIANIMSDRHFHIPSFDQNKTVFDNEHEISKKMLQEKSFNSKLMFYLLCKCYGVHDKGNTYLRVKIKPLGDSKFNGKSFSVLKKYILKFIDQKYVSTNIK